MSMIMVLTKNIFLLLTFCVFLFSCGENDEKSSSLSKQDLMDYYMKLPKVGSKDVVCKYEPKATTVSNKEIFGCDKNDTGYELNKFEFSKNFSAKQYVGYDKNGAVNFSVAYLQSSFPAYTESWFKDSKEAISYVENIFGKADYEEVGKTYLFNTVDKTNYEMTALSWGCKTYYFDRPGSKIKGGRTKNYQNILSEIYAGNMMFWDKHMDKLDREIIKSEVINSNRCTVASILSYKDKSKKMGEADPLKIHLYVADMSPDFQGLKGSW